MAAADGERSRGGAGDRSNGPVSAHLHAELMPRVGPCWETAKKSPSCARIDRLKPAPPRTPRNQRDTEGFPERKDTNDLERLGLRLEARKGPADAGDRQCVENTGGELVAESHGPLFRVGTAFPRLR
jgi:hypothetical protein